MAIHHRISSTIEKFKGLEKRQSDLIDKPGYLSEMKNANIRSSGSISKRKGWHSIISSGMGTDNTVEPILGMATWRGNQNTDSLKSEALAIKKNLTKISTEKLTIENTSLISDNNIIYISLVAEETVGLKFTVQLAGTLYYSETLVLGTGKESTPVTLNDLRSWFNNISTVDNQGNPYSLPIQLDGEGLSGVINNGNLPAAFLLPFKNISISQTQSIDLEASFLQPIPKGDSTYDYFQGLETKYNEASEEFQNVSSANLNSVTYFATGYDEICKYDGAKIYRAGLPQPEEFDSITRVVDDTGLSNLGIAGGTSTDKTHHYMFTYRLEDNNGNIIQSTQSPYKAVDTTQHDSKYSLVEVEIPTLQEGSGFNLADTEIVLWRSPNSQSEPNAASFYQVTAEQSNGDADQSRTILKTALDAFLGNSTASDDYVNVVQDPNDANNYLLTNGFIPNTYTDGNMAVTSVKYLDFLPTNENEPNFITTADYTEGRHDTPPMCKYISVHQGCLVLANKNISSSTNVITTDKSSELFFSLIQFNAVTGEIGTEYFPNNSNSVILEGVSGGPITGVKTLKDNLYVFHDDTVSLLSGDISTLGGQSLRQDLLSSQGEIGSLSSHALQEYEGTLTFLAQDGLMTISNSKPFPVELGQPIKPLLINRDLYKKRAISFYTADDDVMGFMLPVKDNTYPNDVFVDSLKSVVYVFDVKNKAWHKWTNVDISGGIIRTNDSTYFTSRHQGNIYINVFKKDNTEVDFSDHDQPIEFDITTAWDSLGDPAVFKKYIRMKLLITDSNEKFDGGSFSLDMYLRKDFSDLDIGPITFNSDVLGGWGTSQWGIFPWGDRPFTSVGTKLFGKARSIAFKFTNNTLNENVLLTGYTMETASPYKQEIKE